MLLSRTVGELRAQNIGSSHQSQKSASNLGGIEIGEVAPLFVAADQHGQEINLADFRGSRCILVFVSAGCKSCDGTAKALQSLYNDNPDVAILFVGTPLRERNHEYSVRHSLRFPLLTPEPDLAQVVYQVQSVPFAFALDEKGIVRAKGVINTAEHARDLLHRAYTLAIS